MTTKFEVEAFQLRNATLPSWQRKLGIICLVSAFVPKWEGPEPAGLHQVGAVSIHGGGSIDDPGLTLWFYLPRAPTTELDPERLAGSAPSIIRKMRRAGHVPVRVWKSIVFAGPPPGNN